MKTTPKMKKPPKDPKNKDNPKNKDTPKINTTPKIKMTPPYEEVLTHTIFPFLLWHNLCLNQKTSLAKKFLMIRNCY